MRIHIPSIEHAKRVAKRLHKRFGEKKGANLSACQAAIARALGYRDWHELEVATERPDRTISEPDWRVPYDSIAARREYQAQRIAGTPAMKLSLMDVGELQDLMEEIRPSDFERSTGAPSLADKLFPARWSNAFSSEDDEALLLYEIDPMPGLASRVEVYGSLYELTGRPTPDDFKPGHGDTQRYFAMATKPGLPGLKRPDAFGTMGAISLTLTMRGEFIDHLKLCVTNVTTGPSCSEGHLHHLAAHIRRYLDRVELHPNFDGELTTNPLGMDVELECDATSRESRIVARALDVMLRHEFDYWKNDSVLGDNLVDEEGISLFVRRYTYQEREARNEEQAEESDAEESHSKEIAEHILCDTIAEQRAAGSLPQTLAAYLRGSGREEAAGVVAQVFDAERTEAVTRLAALTDELHDRGLMTDAETAFAAGWAVAYGKQRAESAEEHALRWADESDAVGGYEQALVEVGARWSAALHRRDPKAFDRLESEGRRLVIGVQHGGGKRHG